MMGSHDFCSQQSHESLADFTKPLHPSRLIKSFFLITVSIYLEVTKKTNVKWTQTLILFTSDYILKIGIWALIK
jgi:hypothetical protein